MRKSLIAAFVVPALLLAGAVVDPAIAQEKKAEKKADKAAAGKATIKKLGENDSVRAFEVVFKPGDEGQNVERPARVVRALKGGTIERTYADGKKEKTVYKDGEVKVFGPDKPFVPKNVGKSDVHLYVVQIKK